MIEALSVKFIQFERYGTDISKEPMLASPILRSQNGDINVNGNSETAVSGLYTLGEAIGGVHDEKGANRVVWQNVVECER